MVTQRTMVTQRRSNIEIIADMLRIGENGAGKTEIMYSANMSYSQLTKYLTYLIDQGFIDRVELGNMGVNYQLTDHGSKLLESINCVLELLRLSEVQHP